MTSICLLRKVIGKKPLQNRLALISESVLNKRQMETDKAKQILTRQIEAINSLGGMDSSSPAFQKWKRDTAVAIERIFGKGGRHLKDFDSLRYSLSIVSSATSDYEFVEACQNGLGKARAILQSMLEEISEYGMADSAPAGRDKLAVIQSLCERFHVIARQLRQRYADRATLEVEDEYDVQDLLHALLRWDFDDIRPEEWTPSYAGGSSRMDFLLKQEKTVIEVKKTRKGLGAKEVGEQLIIDIQKYQTHPDCKALICFVYDPEGRIANPRGLENDLNAEKDGFKVRVIIAPKGG